MRKPKLFVSHSSADTAVAKEIAAAFADDFDVLLDAIRLEGGDDWQQRIETWMWECHCALVLLSQNARGSDWVDKETFILTSRRRQGNPALRVVPVLLPDFSEEELEQPPFAPAQLEGLQYVRVDPDALDLDPLRRTLDAWRRHFAGWLPWEELESAVAGRLADDEGYLVGILAERLEVEAAELEAAIDRPRWLARRLFALRLDDLEQIVGAVVEARDGATASDLLTKVGPYAWIDAAAAEAFSEEVAKWPPRAPVGLSAAKPRTPAMYVRRASMRLVPWPLLTCPGDFDHDPEAYLVDQVRRCALEKLGYDEEEFDETPDAELLAELRHYIKRHGPVVIQLPKELAELDAALLSAVTGRFEPLTFFLPSARLDAAAAERLGGLCLLPPLDPVHERRVHRAFNRMEDTCTR